MWLVLFAQILRHIRQLRERRKALSRSFDQAKDVIVPENRAHRSQIASVAGGSEDDESRIGKCIKDSS
jgi:hypothetical protein